MTCGCCRNEITGWMGLEHTEAASAYDRIGRLQEWQRIYEGPAVRTLLAHAAFPESHSVLELGCGPGTTAEELLGSLLPQDATYRALEVSPVMAALAGARVTPWRNRARIDLYDGSPWLPAESQAYDRFLAAYVLDLLSPEHISALLSEAHRVLVPGGRLCIVGLTHGASPAAQTVERLWTAAWRLSPRLLGGCRPIEVLRFVSPRRWALDHHEIITAWGLSSEVLVAHKANSPVDI